MSHVLYSSVVGSFMYAMVYTRPYIAHAVGVLRKYMSKLGKEHWTIVNREFRYFPGTTNHAMCYQGISGLDKVLYVHGFVYADWARDMDHRISTSGYVFNLFGGAINWMGKK